MNYRHVRRLGGGLLVSLVTSPALPCQGRGPDAWFEGLKMPGTVIPCCDISDCRRTTADWRGGQWWATVDGQWTPIPPNKELSKRSIDGDAYVCASQNRYVYCFVKPDLTM